MPQGKDRNVKTTTGGIPDAVRAGAEHAGGDHVELGEPRPRRPALPGPVEAAASTVTAGVIRDRPEGADVAAIVRDTAAQIVRGAGTVDADISAAARGAVAGAIEAGRDAGLDPKETGQAAAVGALDAAGDIGEGAVEQVKRIVTGVIAGVRPLDEPLFGAGRRTP